MTAQTSQSYRVPSADADDPVVALPGTLPERPFGVHFRMARWKSLIVLIAAPGMLLVAQIILFQVAALIEGPAEPGNTGLSALQIVAAGLSTGITALLTTVMVARMAKVSWRAVFRHTRRFDWRRLGVYLLGAAALVGLGALASALIAPESTPWGTFGVTAITIGYLIVALLITPVQAAGEEIVFRGAVIPAAGSWFRNIRLAFVFGVIVSGALFALVHVSIEPWFVSYMFVLTACTALMGLISGGLEAAIAFHVSNNVLIGILNALFAGDDATVIDRGVGSGSGPALIILMVMNVSVLAMVWLVERARRSRAR